VTIVLAAVAFVVGFRVHTTNDSAEPAQAALSAKRASAETAPRPAGAKVRLADVAALPELKGESKAAIEARAKQAAAEKRAKARAKAAAERRAAARAKARKQAAAKRKRERAAAARRRAAARRPATPARPAAPRVVVTPVPTPVYRPPVYTPPAPQKKSYVGKDFDSKG
jgi:histone H1/5